ncbi:MAG: dTDP-4-dehydrorhamnose reductase [Desulfovibrio sp.]|jgi:dTDP-4-dehydrorhamnose reductase|nr:dTDP-4-dehydrorhamnose reductase [Desulfovibrio sp.]
MDKALVLGGATGLLGKALVRELERQGWQVGTLGRGDGDITDRGFLQGSIEAFQPDVVLNAVAWTQVDAAEDDPEGARRINRTLPDTLARILKGQGAGHLVHFGTDFVFSGARDRPWTEEDTPEPTSVYGNTKLQGERAVLDVLPDRACVVRTAWLFGPDRENFVSKIMDACNRRDSVDVVHDQTGSPTLTLDLAVWTAALAAGRACGLWHAVNGGTATWCDLACESISMAGHLCRVNPTTSDRWPQKAKRPKYSALDCSKLAAYLGKAPRPWPQALRDYIFNHAQMSRSA